MFGLKEKESESKIAEGTARIDLTRVKIEGYKRLNAQKVNQVIKQAEKIIAQTEVLKDIGIERRNQIVQKTLNDVNENVEKITNLKDMNKLINERILTEGQRLRGEGFKADTAEKIAGAKGGELYLDKRALEVKLDTLKQKLLKETDNAKIAALNQEHAETLKLLEVETAKAKKSRAVNLSDMSAQQKEALGPKILAEATKLEGEIRKDEATILKIQAQTQTEQAARQLKITQNRLNHNKDIIQKLLAPHVRKFAENRALNAQNKQMHDLEKILLRGKPKPEKMSKKGGHPPWWWSDDVDVPDMEAVPFNAIRGDVFELFNKGKTEQLDAKNAQGLTPRMGIIKDMMGRLNIDPKQADAVLNRWLKEFAGEE